MGFSFCLNDKRRVFVTEVGIMRFVYASVSRS